MAFIAFLAGAAAAAFLAAFIAFMAFMAFGMVKKEENELAKRLISHKLHEKIYIEKVMFVSQPDHVTCPHAQSQNNNAIAETLPDMHAGSLIIMMLIFTLIVLTDIHQMKNLF